MRRTPYLLFAFMMVASVGCVSVSRNWDLDTSGLVLNIMPTETAARAGSAVLITESLVNVSSNPVVVELRQVSRMVSPSILPSTPTAEPTSFPENVSYSDGRVRRLAPGESMQEQYSFDAPPGKYSIQAIWRVLLQEPGEMDVRRCAVRSNALDLHIPPREE
jgi:hypothetical protein